MKIRTSIWISSPLQNEQEWTNKKSQTDPIFLWKWQTPSLLFLQLFLSNKSLHTTSLLEFHIKSYFLRETGASTPPAKYSSAWAASHSCIYVNSSVRSQLLFCTLLPSTHSHCKTREQLSCLPTPPVGLVSLLSKS